MKMITISIKHGDGSTTEKNLNPNHIVSIQKFTSTPHNKFNIICIKMTNSEEHNCASFNQVDLKSSDDINN